MGYLVLGRKPEERIRLYTSDGTIEIVVIETDPERARLAIDAPPTVRIMRTELEEEPVG